MPKLRRGGGTIRVRRYRRKHVDRSSEVEPTFRVDVKGGVEFLNLQPPLCGVNIPNILPDELNVDHATQQGTLHNGTLYRPEELSAATTLLSLSQHTPLCHSSPVLGINSIQRKKFHTPP